LVIVFKSVTRDIEDNTDDEGNKPTERSTRIPTTTRRSTWTTTERRTTPKFTTSRPSYSSTTSASKTTTWPNTNNLNLCKDDYDTISFLRNEIFVFKGEVIIQTI